MAEQLKISLIIPAYNRAHLLSETLDSVIQQTYSNWECLVVDDGSTDNTVSLVRHYGEHDKRITILERPSNRTKGSSACRNFGFEQSSGDVIQWFDSDDILLPNAFESYIQCFQKGIDAVVGQVTLTQLATGEKIKTNTFQYSHLIEDYFGGKITFYVCGPMWRRSFLLKQSRLFGEDVRILIDWDFNLRMLCASPRLFFMDASYILYRQHDSSLKTNKTLFDTQKLESAFAIRYVQFQHLTAVNMGRTKVLKKHLRDMHLQIARFSLKVGNNQIFKKHVTRTLSLDLELIDLIHFSKTFLGYLSIRFFGKGYQLLK